MFKKTKVRSILELLGKNLSAREVTKVLNVSRNTVAEVLALFLQSGRAWMIFRNGMMTGSMSCFILISLNISPDMHRLIIRMSIRN